MIELIENHLWICVTLDVDHKTHRFVQVALIADAGDALDAVAIDERRNSFNHPVTKLLIGNLGDDDSCAILGHLLDGCPSTNDDVAASCVVATPNSGPTADDPSRGKIGPLNDRQQFVHRDLGLFNDTNESVTDFTNIVRRYRGRHADRDTHSPVDQQVGKSPR